MNINTEMFRVMRLIQAGGFKMPRYRHRNWRGWNAACYQGYVGEGRDGFEVLTPVGKAKLNEFEQQRADVPLLPAGTGDKDDGRTNREENH